MTIAVSNAGFAGTCTIRRRVIPSSRFRRAPRFSSYPGTGGVRSAIEIEEAQTAQAYHSYEGSVLRAVSEVETALVNVQQERLRSGQLNTAVEKTEKTVNLTKDNYSSGLVSFQSVLDAERSLFNVQDEAAISRGQVSKNLVSLYKALGGGWGREAE